MSLYPGRGAFSLVEVVVALGVLSFSLVAILGLIPIALQAIGTTVQNNAQMRIVQATRTRLLNEPFSSLPLPATTIYTYTVEGLAIEDTPQNSPLIRYRVKMTFSDKIDVPGGELKSVRRVTLTGSNVITSSTYESYFHLPDNGY